QGGRSRRPSFGRARLRKKGGLYPKKCCGFLLQIILTTSDAKPMHTLFDRHGQGAFSRASRERGRGSEEAQRLFSMIVADSTYDVVDTKNGPNVPAFFKESQPGPARWTRPASLRQSCLP